MIKKQTILTIYFIIFFLILLFVSIGYSAFNTSLSISGDAIVRSNADIRITNLELIDKQNGGCEKYNSEYSTRLTSMFVKLPNANSSVTYRVTITNKTSSYFTPGEIKTLINSNTNVKYVIEGIESLGVYKGSSYTFLIKFTTSLANQELNLTLRYDFKTVTSTVWNYAYTGAQQNFLATYKANYKIELWGASGGNSLAVGGKGGYTSGNIVLPSNTTLYVYVGGQGAKASVNSTYINGGYNGGGSAHWGAGCGGGATDVRLVGGVWNLFDSLKSRIMVAGGGGGGINFDARGVGGYAGGLTSGVGVSYSGSKLNNPATQTSGSVHPTGYGPTATQGGDGGFGTGGKGGSESAYSHGSGAGGSGYYGGSGGSARDYSGSGGSSFISGYSGCNAINSTSTSSSISHSGQANHYSGYVFTSGVMIAGNTNMTSPTGTSETGHSGNGYARITLTPLN